MGQGTRKQKRATAGPRTDSTDRRYDPDREWRSGVRGETDFDRAETLRFFREHPEYARSKRRKARSTSRRVVRRAGRRAPKR